MRILLILAAAAVSGAVPAHAAKSPQAQADKLVREAKLQLGAGRGFAAESALDRAIEKDPGHAEAQYMRCALHGAKADEMAKGFVPWTKVTAAYVRAAATCGQAIEAAPESPRRDTVEKLRLRALFETASWDEAAELLGAMGAASPDDGRLAGGHAALLERSGEVYEGARVLEDAVARGGQFERDARFEYVWDRFDPGDASHLAPAIAAAKAGETDPTRLAVFDVFTATAETRSVDALLRYLDVVEGGALNGLELQRLWEAATGPRPDGDVLFPSKVELERDGTVLPTLEHRVSPQYPEMRRRERVEGKVLLLTRVEADGTIGPIWPIRSSGPEFASAAMKAIAASRYKPAMRDGKPVAVPFTVSVHFRLR